MTVSTLDVALRIVCRRAQGARVRRVLHATNVRRCTVARHEMAGNWRTTSVIETPLCVDEACAPSLTNQLSRDVRTGA
jgi:hypothetical protein